MLCPRCNSSQVFVIDSRLSGNTTRRRRRCADCNVRFSTLEVIEYEYKNLKGKELLLRDMLRKATEVK